MSSQLYIYAGHYESQFFDTIAGWAIAGSVTPLTTGKSRKLPIYCVENQWRAWCLVIHQRTSCADARGLGLAYDVRRGPHDGGRGWGRRRDFVEFGMRDALQGCRGCGFMVMLLPMLQLTMKTYHETLLLLFLLLLLNTYETTNVNVHRFTSALCYRWHDTPAFTACTFINYDIVV